MLSLLSIALCFWCILKQWFVMYLFLKFTHSSFQTKYKEHASHSWYDRCRFLCVWYAGSCSSLVKMHSYWGWLCWKIVAYGWVFALSNSFIVLMESVVVSMETNKRHYFWSDLCTLLNYWYLICNIQLAENPTLDLQS